MTARPLRSLARDRRGVTVVEFAMVAPVMILTIMGVGDLMYQTYLQSILDGAMQKAGRDSSLENSAANQTLVDAKVHAIVKNIAKEATFTSERRSYVSFALVKPEHFTDKDKDGIRDAGECFDDVNGNKQWDADPGKRNQGGANDVTKFTMTVTYPRLFPVAKLFGWQENNTLSATTLLKNQPYKTQVVSPIEEICA